MNPTSRDGRLAYAGIAAAAVLISADAFSHIKNEASQFPDIEYSDARFDIVVLVGAGIVPETPVFEPDKPLSRKEMATWVALARGLLPGGETPDTQALAAAVIDEGLMTSLDGDATVGELDALLFDDAAEPENPAATLSKAEAAHFIASRLDTDEGLALLERRGLSRGPTGEVSSVEAVKGQRGSAYVITIGAESLPMDAHGRVANGPTDLLQWEGRIVRRSFVRHAADAASWMYLEATPPGEALPEPEQIPDASSPEETTIDAVEEPPPLLQTPPPDRRLLYWLVAAVILLGTVLFFRRRKKD